MVGATFLRHVPKGCSFQLALTNHAPVNVQLHVEPLWHALLLLVQDLLLGLPEVRLRDPHPPLAQRQQTGLRAHRLQGSSIWHLAAGEKGMAHGSWR